MVGEPRGDAPTRVRINEDLRQEFAIRSNRPYGTSQLFDIQYPGFKPFAPTEQVDVEARELPATPPTLRPSSTPNGGRTTTLSNIASQEISIAGATELQSAAFRELTATQCMCVARRGELDLSTESNHPGSVTLGFNITFRNKRYRR